MGKAALHTPGNTETANAGVNNSNGSIFSVINYALPFPSANRAQHGWSFFYAGTFDALPHRRIAASTACPTSTVDVTAPTPPGTGVTASTMGATASKSTSPWSLPSLPIVTPTSTTVWLGAHSPQ